MYLSNILYERAPTNTEHYKWQLSLKSRRDEQYISSDLGEKA